MNYETRFTVKDTREKSYDNIHNTLAVTCEKSKMASFACSIMKNVVFSFQSRFPVKFGSASSACCLLQSIAIIL